MNVSANKVVGSRSLKEYYQKSCTITLAIFCWSKQSQAYLDLNKETDVTPKWNIKNILANIS